MKLPCGCEPDASGYGYCSACVKNLRNKIWRQMSEDKRNYDRHFDPGGSKELDESLFEGCTCHISPPCSWCVENLGAEDE